jgi:hypothetical protein
MFKHRRSSAPSLQRCQLVLNSLPVFPSSTLTLHVSTILQDYLTERMSESKFENTVFFRESGFTDSFEITSILGKPWTENLSSTRA